MPHRARHATWVVPLVLAAALTGVTGTAAADTTPPVAGTADCSHLVADDPDVVKATVVVTADQEKLIELKATIPTTGTIDPTVAAQLDALTQQAGTDQTALDQAITAATAALCLDPPATTTTPVTTTPAHGTGGDNPNGTDTPTTTAAPTTTTAGTSTLPITTTPTAAATGVDPAAVPTGSVDTGSWP